jgi:hypothetical protein
VRFQYETWVDHYYGLGVNRNLAGGRLRSGNSSYRFGLAMHAPARAEYELDRRAIWFISRLGIDASAGNQGSVIFRVWTRSVERPEWRLDYQSDVVRGHEAPRLCRVDLREATELALDVDVADHGYVLDRALWLDARIVSEDGTSTPR